MFEGIEVILAPLHLPPDTMFTSLTPHILTFSLLCQQKYSMEFPERVWFKRAELSNGESSMTIEMPLTPHRNQICK